MPGDDDQTTAALLAEQAACYRARAAEHDATSYDQDPRSYERVRRIVDGLGVGGRVLEIACGTGVWIAELARHADVLATNASPEVLAIAEQRCARQGRAARFALADAFDPPAGPWDAAGAVARS